MEAYTFTAQRVSRRSQEVPAVFVLLQRIPTGCGITLATTAQSAYTLKDAITGVTKILMLQTKMSDESVAHFYCYIFM